MRPRWIVAIGVAVALGLLAGASVAIAEGDSEGVPTSPPGEAVPLDSSCPSGHACVWPSRFYVGTKGESLCTGGAHGLAAEKESGKNSCANKAVWFRQNGSAITCLNPGGEAASFAFPINEVWVGAEGSRC